MCINSSDFYLVNTSTGESHQLPCNTYSCPECGKRKAGKLRHFLHELLQTWTSVRFWTFTLRYTSTMDEKEHQELLAECWRRFITYARRSKSLRQSARRFQYVKVYENHKSGYWHLHVLVDTYLPYSVVQPIWEAICQEVLGISDHAGQSFVKGFMASKTAAFYVTKYVLKAAQEIARNIRRYSTSHGIKLFPQKVPNLDWMVFRVGISMCEQVEQQAVQRSPLLVCTLHNFTEPESHEPDFYQYFMDFIEDCR